MKFWLKFILSTFCATCMLICWLTDGWTQAAGLFAIALTILCGGNDEDD